MSQLSTPSAIQNPTSVAVPAVESGWKVKLADYAELAKARIAVMVLVTVAVGFLIGQQGSTDWAQLAFTLLGVGLIAASSCTLNQYFEIDTDLKMDRTRNRPLPSGRIQPWEALVFAAITGVVGLAALVLLVNTTVALLTFINWFLYIAIYTPMKRWTSVCTAVGAIPGAMPPVLGWAAAGQPLGWEAFWLFSLMFLWQFPHFLAIAWLYRHDYYKAGLWMLPNGLPARYITGILAVTYALILLPVSLLPQQYGLAGDVFFWVALVFGCAYLYYSVRFLLNETRQTARQLLFCSLFYLPIVLTTLTWNHLSVVNSYAMATPPAAADSALK